MDGEELFLVDDDDMEGGFELSFCGGITAGAPAAVAPAPSAPSLPSVAPAPVSSPTLSPSLSTSPSMCKAQPMQASAPPVARPSPSHAATREACPRTEAPAPIVVEDVRTHPSAPPSRSQKQAGASQRQERTPRPGSLGPSTRQAPRTPRPSHTPAHTAPGRPQTAPPARSTRRPLRHIAGPRSEGPQRKRQRLEEVAPAEPPRKVQCLGPPTAAEEEASRAEYMQDFARGPWLAMLQAVDMAPFPVASLPCLGVTLPQFQLSGSIDFLKRQGICSRIRQLVVLLKKVELTSTGALAVLKDPTGMMKAAIHREVVEEHQQHVAEGAVFVLQNVPMYSPSPFVQHLNIMRANVVRVFGPKVPVPVAYAAVPRAKRKSFVDDIYAPHARRVSTKGVTPVRLQAPGGPLSRLPRPQSSGHGSPAGRPARSAPFKPPRGKGTPMQGVRPAVDVDSLLAGLPDDAFRF